MSDAFCPALLIAAPASGQGKTSTTIALARLHTRAGRRVRVFKCGPDFIDPMFHAQATGAPVYQLDPWMCGEAHCRALLHAAAREADLILVEGVMGLYDGAPSTADTAALFGLPVLAVIDAQAMAQTFGAVAYGLAHYRPGIELAGVVANRVAGEAHRDLLASSLPGELALWASLPRAAEYTLPERHLGLVQAEELADFDARADALAAAWATHGRIALPREVRFPVPGEPAPLPLLHGVRIAVANDAAFAFLYQANLDLLEAMGAQLRYFSPLADSALPPADALYLPGGYPELHLDALANNHALAAAVRAHHDAGKPIVAECGGMLWLLQSLADTQGRRAPMLGLLPGHATMAGRLGGLGLQEAALPEGTLRGHSFHWSTSDIALDPIARAHNPNGGATAEAIYRVGRITASYMHFYLPSNPPAAAALFLP